MNVGDLVVTFRVKGLRRLRMRCALAKVAVSIAGWLCRARLRVEVVS